MRRQRRELVILSTAKEAILRHGSVAAFRMTTFLLLGACKGEAPETVYRAVPVERRDIPVEGPFVDAAEPITPRQGNGHVIHVVGPAV